MPRSTPRRAATGRGADRRILAAVAAIIVVGGVIGVTQISNAGTNGDGQQPGGGQQAGGGQNNGLQILGNDCSNSRLQPHDGFQKGNRCSSTAFGEVSAAGNNPSLLITRAPESVEIGRAFRLKVSTRNLVRDRFLGAAAGGYYLESSFLNEAGLQRGHFHVACRMLESTRSAPAPDPVPAFFRAVEDGGGGARPDAVTVEVTGMPAAGTAQCTVWAGDGSHRAPMMERANQTPAFDAVRIEVKANRQEPPQDGGGNDAPPAGGGNDAPPAGGGKGNGNGNGNGAPPPPEDDLPPVEDNLPPVDDDAPPADDEDRPPAKGNDQPAPGGNADDDSGKGKGKGKGKTDGNEDASAGDDSTAAPAPAANAQDDDPATEDPATEDPGTAETPALEDTEQVASDDPLAQTGDRTLPLFGVGAVMLLVGLMILLSARTRRPGGGW